MEKAGPLVYDLDEVYRGYWQTTADGLFSVRVSGDDFFFEALNPSHEAATGLPTKDIAGRRPHEILDSETADLVVARYRQCVEEDRPISYFETLALPSGRQDWETTLTPQHDADGRVIRLHGVARALTRLPKPDELITPSQRELRRTLDLSPNRVAILDRNGAIIYVNRAWREQAPVSGCSGELGSNYLDACTGEGVRNGAALRDKLKRLLDGEIITFAFPYATGDRHYVLRATRIILEAMVFVMASHQDVTEAVRTQRELADVTERLLAVQEEERARIAVELHDSTSQHLVAVGLGLAALKHGKAREGLLDDMRLSLAEAHKEIRTLSYLLHPPKLSQQGLAATLRTFIDGFQRRTSLTVTTTLNGALETLPFDLQKTVFRIVQEALANIHRHAGAQRCAVDITLGDEDLRVTIVDDGKGPPAELVTGVGIQGMEARVHQFRGRLSITHQPFGMMVDATIPRSGFKRAIRVGQNLP